MDWSQVTALTIPEGNVTQIAVGDIVLWSKSKLPAGYTEVEYLQSDGNQYIDTGIVTNTNDSILIKTSIIPLSTSSIQFYFGTRISDNRFGLANYPLGYFDYAYYADRNTSVVLKVDTNYDIEWVANNDERSVTINGTKKDFTSDTSANLINNNFRLWLFSRNYNNIFGQGAVCRMGITEVIIGGNLVGNFIPCRRNSDGKVGMYDLVTGEFKSSMTNTDFIAGDEVQAINLQALDVEERDVNNSTDIHGLQQPIEDFMEEGET